LSTILFVRAGGGDDDDSVDDSMGIKVKEFWRNLGMEGGFNIEGAPKTMFQDENIFLFISR